MKRVILFNLAVMLCLSFPVEAQTLGEVLRAVQNRNTLVEIADGATPIKDIHWVGGIGKTPSDDAVNQTSLETQIKLLRQAWREVGVLSQRFYDERFLRGDTAALNDAEVEFDPQDKRIDVGNFAFMTRLLAYRVSKLNTLPWKAGFTRKSGLLPWVSYAGLYPVNGHYEDGSPIYGEQSTLPNNIQISMFEHVGELWPQNVVDSDISVRVDVHPNVSNTLNQVELSYVSSNFTVTAPILCAGRFQIFSSFGYEPVRIISGFGPDLLKEPGSHPLGEVEVDKDESETLDLPTPLGEFIAATLTGTWKYENVPPVEARSWIPQMADYGSSFLDPNPSDPNSMAGGTTVELKAVCLFTADFNKDEPEFSGLPEREIEEAPILALSQKPKGGGLRLMLAEAPANECALEWDFEGVGAEGFAARSLLKPLGGGKWDAVFSSADGDREAMVTWAGSANTSQGRWASFHDYISRWWRPVLKQLVCETYGVDIVQNAGSYKLRFFRKDQVGEKSNGVYSFRNGQFRKDRPTDARYRS